MKPKPLPKTIEKSGEWKTWLTLDDLRAKRPDLKLHRVRALVAYVTCYRCPDQTVRYAQDEIEELIDEEEELDNKCSEVVDADGKVSPARFEMVIFRETMRTVSEVTKSLSELRKMIGDISSAATEPLTLGLGLVREHCERINARLEHHENRQDETLTLYETLASMQTDRDLMVQKAKGNQEVRQQALGAIMAYGPTLIRDLRQSARSNPAAAAALEAIELLEPEVLDAIVDSADHTPAQRAAWTKVRDALKQTKQAQANQQSNHHAPS